MIYGQTPAKESRPIQTDDSGALVIKQASLNATAGGTSQQVSISTTSAQSAAISSPVAVAYSTTDCFFRQGSNPTALSDGTDQFLPASTLLRLTITSGNKLAFKTGSGSGTVYITPGA